MSIEAAVQASYGFANKILNKSNLKNVSGTQKFTSWMSKCSLASCIEICNGLKDNFLADETHWCMCSSQSCYFCFRPYFGDFPLN